ncbi:MAG: hypothetical protein RBU45_18590 [Myxococcota bacterium]|jgi:hypothetical protein|nr:hypothetical protein [Myxococcota bacterium]
MADDPKRELKELSVEVIRQGRQLLPQVMGGSTKKLQRPFEDDGLGQRASVALQLLNASPDLADAASRIAQAACQTFLAAKQLDSLTQQYTVAAQQSVDKVRVIAPSLTGQLQVISGQITNVLQMVAAIDSKTCSPEELEYRDELIQLAREWSKQVYDLLMKLMTL